MRKVVRQLLIAALVITLLTVVGASCLYQASRVVPTFYREALAAALANKQEQGRAFEQHALALHNQLYQAGAWEVQFTQDEINGWLAADLPDKFPQVLPPGVSEPRISIEAGIVRLAVHYQRGSVDTVVSVAGDAWLTDQPNEIAVRIDQARAGLVPVPLGRFLQEIGERAARANVPLRWTESKGAPVALVRLPLDTNDAGRLMLQRLDIVGNELVVAGRTDEEPRGQTTVAQPADSETRQR